MRFIFGYFIAVACLAAYAFAPQAAAGSRYEKQKVVYHINGDGGENGKLYKAALQNVRNHLDAVGAGNVELKVVLHGDGLGLLMKAMTDKALESAVVGLKNEKVAFNVCNFTIERRKINPDKDLFEVFAEDIVPSGVAELARLQQLGYTYIKP